MAWFRKDDGNGGHYLDWFRVLCAGAAMLFGIGMAYANLLASDRALGDRVSVLEENQKQELSKLDAILRILTDDRRGAR